MGTAQQDPTAQDVVEGFARDLASLRAAHGNPSFAQMGRAVRHMSGVCGSRSTFQRMVKEPRGIPSAGYVQGFATALGCSEDEIKEWETRRLQAWERSSPPAPEKVLGDADRPVGTVAPPQAPRRRFVVVVAAGLLAAAGATALVLALTRSSGAAAEVFADGTDPMVTGCSTPAETADSVRVYFPVEHSAGVLELRTSKRCGMAWARFTPSVGLGVAPPVTIEVDVRRPADNGAALFHVTSDGQEAYGNMLRADHQCVYAVVTLKRSGRTSVPFGTLCRKSS